MRYAISSALAALALVFVSTAVGQSKVGQLEQRLQGTGAALAGTAARATSATDAAPATSDGYLGAELDDEKPQGKGLLVTRVKPGTAAEKAGLKDNDLITAINGKQMKNFDDYDSVAKGRAPGTRLQLTIERDGRPQSVTVMLGTRPAATDQTPVEPSVPSTPATSPPGPGTPGAGSPSLGPATGSTAPPLSSASPGRFEATPRSPTTPESPLPLVPPPTTDATSPSLPGGGYGSFPAPAATTGGGASLGISVETADGQPRVGTIGPVRRGAFITQVKPGSPAAQAGLPV